MSYLNTLINARTERLRQLRELRRVFRTSSPSNRNHTCKLLLGVNRLPRVTAKAITKEALANASYAHSPIGDNPLSTESYSACGWEDGEALARESYLELAKEQASLALLLKAFDKATQVQTQGEGI